MNVSLITYDPAPLLQPYVETYWHGEFNRNQSPDFSQLVMPNGFLELIVHLGNKHCYLYQNNHWSQSPAYTLIGLFTKPYQVNFDERVFTFGIRFKPEGIYNLFGIPAAEFSEDYIDMESVLGRSFSDFSNRLKEQKDLTAMIKLADEYLLNNLNRNRINVYYLNHAAELIRKNGGLMKMDDLSGNVFIGRRQLEREFKAKIGLSPKQYMRLARLNDINRQLQQMKYTNLTDLSYQFGYSDQSHFIRDFKSLSTTSPSHLLKRIDDFIINV